MCACIAVSEKSSGSHSSDPIQLSLKLILVHGHRLVAAHTFKLIIDVVRDVLIGFHSLSLMFRISSMITICLSMGIAVCGTVEAAPISDATGCRRSPYPWLVRARERLVKVGV